MKKIMLLAIVGIILPMSTSAFTLETMNWDSTETSLREGGIIDTNLDASSINLEDRVATPSLDSTAPVLEDVINGHQTVQASVENEVEVAPVLAKRSRGGIASREKKIKRVLKANPMALLGGVIGSEYTLIKETQFPVNGNIVPILMSDILQFSYEFILTKDVSFQPSVSFIFGFDYGATLGLEARWYFQEKWPVLRGWYLGPDVVVFALGRNDAFIIGGGLGGKVGYQWIWDRGFTVDAYVGTRYVYAVEDYQESTNTVDRLSPNLGAAIGYAW